MCRPTFYGIEYEINPWMDVRRQADRRLALRQWQALYRTLQDRLGAEVHLCRPRPGLPDMCFTANAGLVYRGAFISSRFRYVERAREEAHFTPWFRRHGFRVLGLRGDGRFEGAGDALFVGDTLFAGYRYRTDIQTHVLLGELLGVRVFSLELVNPHFYHLDTCFCPMGPASALYYPAAFDSYARRVLRENIPELVEASAEEAYQFGCNAVFVGKKAVLPEGCPKLTRALERRGYEVIPLPLSEFLKAGGSAKCLTLRID